MSAISTGLCAGLPPELALVLALALVLPLIVAPVLFVVPLLPLVSPFLLVPALALDFDLLFVGASCASVTPQTPGQNANVLDFKLVFELSSSCEYRRVAFLNRARL